MAWSVALMTQWRFTRGREVWTSTVESWPEVCHRRGAGHTASNGNALVIATYSRPGKQVVFGDGLMDRQLHFLSYTAFPLS